MAPSAYFVGIAAIVTSGVILKKTRLFAGNPAPFVMELPAYHMPTGVNVLRSVWERGSSFIKRAGTIILASAVIIWFLSSFGVTDEAFGPVDDLRDGLLAAIGTGVAWIFAPLGFGDWQATVAAFTGLVAKENIISTFGVLYGFAEVAEDGAEIWGNLSSSFTPLSAYAFLVFNLLCAPCFAAIGAIRREMNSAKWTFIAIGYQTAFAYAVSMCIFQFGSWAATGSMSVGTIAALAAAGLFLFLLLRPMPSRA
jgi:ferrous iron transport protein B